MDNMAPVLHTDYTRASEEEEVRSPRTPNWIPTTPSLSSPFDYTKFFATSPSEPTDQPLPLPPDKPLPWVWQCHLCRNRYPLSVTRRCLYDGHFYCSGETDRPNLRKKKKGLACSSEFDYEGWEDFGNWRQQALKAVDKPRLLVGCETCEFPSQCRAPTALHPPKQSKKKTTVAPLKDTGTDKITTIDPRLLDQPQRKPSTQLEANVRSKSTQTSCNACPPSQKESRVQDLVDSLHGSTEKTATQSEKMVRKRLRKQNMTLASIEENSQHEALRSLQDLILPVMDHWRSLGNVGEEEG